jgi:hypothetical protein
MAGQNPPDEGAASFPGEPMSIRFLIALALLPVAAWAGHGQARPPPGGADAQPAAAEVAAGEEEGDPPPGKKLASASEPVQARVSPSLVPQPEPDSAAEGGLHAGADLDLNSRFLWRGASLSHGPVLQPAAWISGYGFTATVFANLLLNDESPQSTVSLVVPAVTYAYVLDRLKIEPGVIYYGSTLANESTWEATLDVAWRLGPSLRLVGSHSFDGGKHAGAYHGSIGAEVERDLSSFILKAGVDIGWATGTFNRAYFGADTGAIDVLEGRLAIQHDLSDHLYFVVHVEASALLDSALRQHADQTVLVNGGISLGAQF